MASGTMRSSASLVGYVVLAVVLLEGRGQSEGFGMRWFGLGRLEIG